MYKNRGALLRQVVGWVFSDFVGFFFFPVPGRGRVAPAHRAQHTVLSPCIHENTGSLGPKNSRTNGGSRKGAGGACGKPMALMLLRVMEWKEMGDDV